MFTLLFSVFVAALIGVNLWYMFRPQVKQAFLATGPRAAGEDRVS